jgi:hypothetical protein
MATSPHLDCGPGSRRARVWLARGCFVALLTGATLIGGCAHREPPPARVDSALQGAWETASGQRTVSVQANGRRVELGFTAEKGNGEVRINQHVIRIERAHLVINGRTSAAVPVAAQQFTVTLLDETLEVRADGLTLYQRAGFK